MEFVFSTDQWHTTSLPLCTTHLGSVCNLLVDAMDFYSEIEVYMKDIFMYYPNAGQLKEPQRL